MNFIRQNMSTSWIKLNDRRTVSSEYLFYSVHYANNLGKTEDNATNLNAVQLDNSFHGKNIDLRNIKELLPTYKFCCCSLEKCVCEFIIRYKSRDPNGTYPWIWCDIINMDDVAIPYDSSIVLRVLVYCNNLSYNNCDIEDTEQYKNEHVEDYVQSGINDQNDHFIKEKSNFVTKGKNVHIFESSKMHDLLPDLKTTTFSCEFSNQRDLIISDSCDSVDGFMNNDPNSSPPSTHIINNNDENINNKLLEDISEEVNQWSKKSDGTYKDIRVLLSSLQHVLWKSAQWEPVEFSQLMTDSELVKRVYRKALILCHPDKHQKEHELHKIKVHQIFMAINEAHNKSAS